MMLCGNRFASYYLLLPAATVVLAARLCRCAYQQGTSLQSPVHGVVTGVLGNRRGEQPVIGNHLFQGGDLVVVVLPVAPLPSVDDGRGRLA